MMRRDSIGGRCSALAGAAMLLAASVCGPAVSAPSPDSGSSAPPRMQIVSGHDLEAKVLKKLGLPARHYCFEECLRTADCAAVRWGVIQGMTSGMCIFLTGELKSKPLGELKTDDGQRIAVVVATKVPASAPARTP